MILDASAAVDALVGTTRAEAVLHQIERADHLAAPQLLHVEVASALWRLVRTTILAPDVAESALARLRRLRVDLLDHEMLLPLAWGFRESNRLTDCFYLAAAMGLDTALLTTDGRLGRSHHGVRVIAIS